MKYGCQKGFPNPIRSALPFFVLLVAFSLNAAPPDSSRSAARRSPAKQNGSGKEIVLDEIQIQGEIEKPSVIIVPKRIEPELPEKELERSFADEVKRNAGELPEPADPVQKVETVPSIKKALEKKRD
jgi:hypothetical protein